MRDLYDQLILEGEAGIQRLIDERAQEGLQLDFKQKARPENGAFEDGDRKILAKAISGFANSAGGLIVWGVNAEKVEGVDCAQPPAAPISQIERFSSEAATLVGQLIQPRHDGVHIAPIRSAAADGAGFLLIYVERSERRPHRSEAKAQKQYFKRAGDSFFEMEHYDIEDAFRRISVPKLSLDQRFTVSQTDGGGKILQGYLEFFLQNDSAISARSPYFQLKQLFGAHSGITPSIGFIETNEGDWRAFSSDSNVVVHPGLSRSIVRFKIEYDWHPSLKLSGTLYYNWGIAFDCRFGCENAKADEQTVEFDHYQLQELMRA